MHSGIVRLLAPQFVQAVREKGSSYFWAGRVQNLKGDDYSAQGTVRGGGSYRVSIENGKSGIKYSCSCPYFRENGNCKHLWALILASVATEPAYLGSLDQGTAPSAATTDTRKPKPTRPAIVPRWRKLLDAVSYPSIADDAATQIEDRLIHYTLDAAGIHEGDRLVLNATYQDRRKNGGWGASKSLNLARLELAELPDALDRQILASLRGCRRPNDDSYQASHPGPFALSREQADLLLPMLCATGRFTARNANGVETGPLTLDTGEPWRFLLRMQKDQESAYHLRGFLQRGTESLPLSQPTMLLQAGWVFVQDRMARLDHEGSFHWISALRQTGEVAIAEAEAEPFLKQLLDSAHLPFVELPNELQVNFRSAQPKIRLQVRPHPHALGTVQGSLQFQYEERVFTERDGEGGGLDWEQRSYFRRNRSAEREARQFLLRAGFHRYKQFPPPEFSYELVVSGLPAAIRTLLPLGWSIEASGKIYRTAKAFSLKVSSGTDWFDLNGRAEFDGAGASLPALLKAIRSGETTMVLDDGSLGLVPEEWLRRVGALAALGTESDGGTMRFQRDQALLLDALLAEQPDVDVDATFDHIRTELRNFKSVEALDAPEGFQGTLRPYQREGLGWFDFLRRFTFGGCLADDMGLGKTVQVLALLEKRRQENAGPSLVVVPRSLMFNWREEARRFTPQLRILEHSGIGRARSTGHLADYDVVLTTYGTLRSDAILLKEMTFDYVILDEAQAIKNAATHSAKAARLLKGKYRLALSGTPVENHLGELWSLFEFLNPGMMGRSSSFSAFTGTDVAPETRHVLARALRPFILRRTKGQVAKELPARVEQTIHCDLPPHQRKLYNELREFYRQSLLKKVDTEGLGKSKIMVLEALLRLRQAACHPGLVDKARKDEESAKLSALIPQLLEVTQEGHKALVFSQFTSFLSLVKKQMDTAGIPYEYLDGKTKDRQAKVEKFQNDPDCRVFLISLRAGGLGLNLTAAEYVFLLDPWWNPAVEAQAIDRAHRIGQKQQVFAYRLIARDTIEEKVLQLQASKRDLASAIITEDQSILRNLTREDLELLLG